MYKKFLMICIASCFASHAASLDLSQATQETLDTLCAIMEDSGNTNEILTQINTYQEFVHSFINHGGDINAPIYPKDQTALMMAAQYQQSSLVKILVTAGANPSMKDSLGFSALTYALVAAYSQNPTLKNACLIAAGYDPNNHKKTVHYLLTSVAKENQEAFIHASIDPVIYMLLDGVFALPQKKRSLIKQTFLSALEQIALTTATNDTSTQYTVASDQQINNSLILLQKCSLFVSELYNYNLIESITTIQHILHNLQKGFIRLQAHKYSQEFISSLIAEELSSIKTFLAWSFDTFETIVSAPTKQATFKLIVSNFSVQLILEQYETMD